MTEHPLPEMTIEVSPDGEGRWQTFRLPYDPRLHFSILPYDDLRIGGFQPEGLNEVRVGDTIEDRMTTHAFFRYRDRVTRSLAVFGKVEDRRAWGWHAVYYLGWEIDPETGALREANLDRPSPI